MSRPLIDSPFIFGIHEPGGERHMRAAGRPGWILFSEVLGHDPKDLSGVDYTAYSGQGLGIIARLNHGYEPDGTIPHSSQYEAFARRVANFANTSRGCKTWVIGNEMNYAIERPGIKVDWSRHASRRSGEPSEADPTRRGLAVRFSALPDNSREIRTTRGAIISPGEVITPELYARCYRLCRDAIKRLPGHDDDLVLVGAVAPWNTQTIYPGNPNGDWVRYFRDILDALGQNNCDGFAIHAYTHGADANLITSPTKLGAPFQSRHLHFRVYADFMEAVPENMRHLAAFIAEAGQVEPWPRRNTGWVQAMYSEVDNWNRQPANQQIRAAILYRWPRLDRWYIDGKQEIEYDFQAALRNDFRWRGGDERLDEATVAGGDGVLQGSAEVTELRGSTAEPQAPEVTAPTQRGRKRRQRPTEIPPYSIEWIADEFPARLQVGETIVVPITVRNIGSQSWTWGGGNPFRLGYRYYRNRRPLAMAPGKEHRTDIPENVEPGQTVVIQARIALPDEPGNYTLELDLVHEGVTWFKERGSPVLTRWLTVEAATPAAERGTNGLSLPVRLFHDITRMLPKSGTPYARRDLNQIRYIVVNHTGANPHVALEHIARAHIKRGYPGIAYDFVVDATGQILKVTDLEDVAQPDQVWSEQGVNICLAGNFNLGAPPLQQLDGAGRLCAWLAQNLGMTAEAIVGLGELTHSDSPGETFYRGTAWKEVLTRQVRLHLAALGMAASDTDRVAEHERTVAALQAAAVELQGKLDAATTELHTVEQDNARLAAKIADLERRLEAQPTVVEGGLRLHLVADTLPRESQRYTARGVDDVEMIVIHHTGTAPEFSLRELAETHRGEWPGILFDFVIDAKGGVFQTQYLEEVPNTTEQYVRNAINVAFAGDFTGGRMPTAEQIASGGRLIAWLLERYPKADFDTIRGAGDFAATTSPGDEWTSGRAWKHLLITSARRAAGFAGDSMVETALRDQLQTLEADLLEQRQARVVLEHEQLALVEENRRLQEERDEHSKGPVEARFVVPKPGMHVIVDQLPKHPVLRYARRSLSQITHIAIHHTAAPQRVGPTRIAELHIAADSGRGKEAWPGIGYHYFVHADGSIEQTNYLETVSYHVLHHYGYSVGIAFAGSFMNGKIPTSAQLRAGAHLVAWLMQELNIPLARVWGHREYPDNMTVCPGGEWTQGNRWRDLLFERIEQIEKGIGLKSTRHYMLFPGGDAGGFDGEILMDALGYITRFRPTVGFSIHEARNAEYVTIVGGEAGITRAEEEMLLQSGCKVERVAGRDGAETTQLLVDMARAGRRFGSFQVDF